MTIQPLGNNLLIKPEKQPDRTSSGIILAIKDDLIVERGEVIEVGPHVEGIQKGDTIIFKSYNLDRIELDGQDLAFLKDENVIALV